VRFQEHHAVSQKQEALVAKFKETFPDVKSVYDPPAQAQKEIDSLRAAAGRPGDGDIETLMQAAEVRVAADHSPIENLRYEPGKLTLPASGWYAAGDPELHAPDAHHQRRRPVGHRQAPAEPRARRRRRSRATP
jgi:hypothetical protein